MDWQKLHDRLIDRARRRVAPDCYTERHHVTPRSIGGKDEASNLVNLTLHEHIVVHCLLYLLHRKEHPNLVFAIAAFYEDANRFRMAYRKVRRMPKWVRKARQLRTAAILREMGYQKTQRLNKAAAERKQRL